MSKEKLYCLSGTVSSELCEMLRALSCLSLFLTFNQNRIFSNLTLIHTFIPFFLSFLFFFFFLQTSLWLPRPRRLHFILLGNRPVAINHSEQHCWSFVAMFFSYMARLNFFFFFFEVKFDTGCCALVFQHNQDQSWLSKKKKKKKKWEGVKPQSGCKPCIPVLS